MSLNLLAGYLNAHGDTATAEKLLREAQSKYPGDFWINQNLAYHFMASKPSRWEQAIRFLTAAVALRPQSSGARLKLGWTLCRHGLLDEASAPFEAAIALKPDYAGAYWYFGILLRDKHDYEGAVPQFSKGLELRPNDAGYWVGRSDAYLRLKQWDKALADCNEAIKLDPARPSAWSVRAEAYRGLGQLQQTLADYSHLIKLQPNHFPSRYRRAELYMQLGQLEDAVADFSRAIALDPENYSARSARGHAYRGLRQWDEALADLSKLIDLHPDVGENWLIRGQTYYQMGLLDNAVADFAQAIKRQPTLSTAWADRGRVYALRAEWKEAADDFAKVVALEPDAASYWLLQSCACLGAGDKGSYRVASAGMLERFHNTKDPVVAALVVSTCVMAPEAGADPAQLVTLAELACSVNTEWNNGLLGAALFRADKPSVALECFHKKAKCIPARPWDLLFMAMAHHRLGQTELSRRIFDQAVQWIAVADRTKVDNVNHPAETIWESWQEKIAAHVLRGEAQALIQGDIETLPK